jgi:hypothetical protein
VATWVEVPTDGFAYATRRSGIVNQQVRGSMGETLAPGEPADIACLSNLLGLVGLVAGFAAFAASGAMHAVAVLGAGPLRVVALPCVCVLWCFLGHGAAVLIEQRLGWQARPVGRWSHAIARIRTLLLFLALTPGLIEPFAAVANVHGRSLAVVTYPTTRTHAP